MSNELANYEVAIIGLGPVGAAFANILGQFGIKTVILEREAGTYNLPRAVMFDDEIMRLFQTMGLAEKVLKVSEVGGGARFIDANDNTLVHWSRSEALSPNNWYSNYRFHQPDLENVLREGYRRYPHVTEMWNCDVIDLHQTDDDVTVIYHKGSNNSNKSLRANYVVGCDGARSFTRDNINPDILDLGFHEPWLVIDLLMNNPEKIESRESLHFCQPNCSGTYVFLGSKRKRWEFRINQSDEVEDICRPEFIWSLLKQWISPEEAELERATVYTFHSMIAKQWRQGRLFIAGDAAHQTPPFMGQGMCAGIRDAANLGWKLQAILRRGASETLLKSYQTERQPHVQEYIDLTIQMGHMINRTATAIIAGNATDPEDGPQTMRQLKPLLGPGIGIGRSPLIGSLFPQPKLSSGILLDDAIGNSFALITSVLFHLKLTKNDQEKIEKLGIVIISNDADQLEDWFKKNTIEAVLLRPDRYILGTATRLSELSELLLFFDEMPIV